jgi:hypothetical protein
MYHARWHTTPPTITPSTTPRPATTMRRRHRPHTAVHGGLPPRLAQLPTTRRCHRPRAAVHGGPPPRLALLPTMRRRHRHALRYMHGPPPRLTQLPAIRRCHRPYAPAHARPPSTTPHTATRDATAPQATRIGAWRRPHVSTACSRVGRPRAHSEATRCGCATGAARPAVQRQVCFTLACAQQWRFLWQVAFCKPARGSAGGPPQSMSPRTVMPHAVRAVTCARPQVCGVSRSSLSGCRAVRAIARLWARVRVHSAQSQYTVLRRGARRQCDVAGARVPDYRRECGCTARSRSIPCCAGARRRGYSAMWQARGCQTIDASAGAQVAVAVYRAAQGREAAVRCGRRAGARLWTRVRVRGPRYVERRWSYARFSPTSSPHTASHAVRLVCAVTGDLRGLRGYGRPARLRAGYERPSGYIFHVPSRHCPSVPPLTWPSQKATLARPLWS